MQAVLNRLAELRTAQSSQVGPWTTTPWDRLREIVPKIGSYNPRAGYALIASIAVHAAFFLLFAQIMVPGYARNVIRDLKASVVEEPVEIEEIEESFVMLAEPNKNESENVLSSLAMATAIEVSEMPEVESDVEPLMLEEHTIEVPPIIENKAFQQSDVVVTVGSIGEQVEHVEGAVDRITHEIATNLERSDVLVVWLMDASISLVEDREAVAERLSRVYGEIDQLENFREEALLSAAVAYGKSVQDLVAPTSDGHAVVEAIRNVPVDESGVENVFDAIGRSITQYRPHIRNGRKMMIIVWTDESGDDLSRLEDVVRTCQRLAVPVYTVGPSSMFGREMGTHAYTHPDDGETYQLPVTRGPDTLRPERLRVPYWFKGPQLENLRAGVAPYALTRLSQESGGAYFINEDKADRAPFALGTMRSYMPDYSSPEEYSLRVRTSRLRTAVLQAVDVTMERPLKGTPELEFAPTGANFQQQLREAQQTVAYNTLILDRALGLFGAKGMEDEYLKESSARWRAWYDLTYGRLLAMKVRCDEYNWTCAEMKGKGSDFVDKESNRWKFKPSTELTSGTATERTATEAIRLLERCVTNNPGTPWEQLAKRELLHPFGFAIDEAYVEPPKPEMNAGGNNPNPPQGLRTEKARKLDRGPKVNLPKL